MPEDNSKGKPSTKERLVQEIESRLNEASDLQQKSEDLRKEAEEKEKDDPEAAAALRDEARETDKKAAKLMKTAERLQSGWLQGGALGTGIGAGIASGIGVTVGTLVTGVVAIPTSGLGMLLGAGTGLVHGSWVKCTDSFSKEESDKIVKEAEEEAEKIADS